MQTANIPIEISQTAGTFVCNHIFYALMRTLAAKPAHSRPRGGFVHIPFIPERTQHRPETCDMPDMPLDTVIDALRTIIETALNTHIDQSIAAGATH